jgi:hypothetical protein
MKLEIADGRHEDTAQDPNRSLRPPRLSASRSPRVPGPWKRSTSSINHSKSFAGLRRRPPFACGRAPVESERPKCVRAQRKKRRKGVASRTGMLQKTFTSWSKARFRCETKPGRGRFGSGTKTKFLSLFLDEVRCGERLLVL